MPASRSERERDYERRRHQAWQRRQAEKAAERRRRRSTGLAAGVVVLVVAALAVGAFWFTGVTGSDSPDAAAAGATASTAASPDADACPSPTSTPAATTSGLTAAPDASLAQGRTWTGTIATSCGDIGISLDGAKAPQAVASFITLAGDGFFAGTPCHRLTTTGIYVLQCGDPTGTGTGGPGYSFGPIENAPTDGVYPAGTIAMARQGGNASSQGSQFFLVYQDSTIPSDAVGGYTVLGTITSGLDVVQRVADAGDDDSNGAGDGRPTTPISIEQVTVQ